MTRAMTKTEFNYYSQKYRIDACQPISLNGTIWNGMAVADDGEVIIANHDSIPSDQFRKFEHPLTLMPISVSSSGPWLFTSDGCGIGFPQGEIIDYNNAYDYPELRFVLDDQESKSKQFEICECSICCEQLHHPKRLGCAGGHIYCESCVERIMDTDRRCPYCRSQLMPAKIKNVHTMVNCTRGSKCDFSGELSKWSSHNCDDVMGTCGQCGEKMPAHHFSGHVKKCRNALTSCAACNNFIGTKKWLREHAIHECPQRFVRCSSCSVILESSKIADHLIECPAELCSCPFESVGCDTVVRRDGMRGHMDRLAQYHLTIMTKYCNQQRDLINSYQELLYQQFPIGAPVKFDDGNNSLAGTIVEHYDGFARLAHGGISLGWRRIDKYLKRRDLNMCRGNVCPRHDIGEASLIRVLNPALKMQRVYVVTAVNHNTRTCTVEIDEMEMCYCPQCVELIK